MNDAAQTATENPIHELLAILLTTCNPSNPNRLWLNYREHMSDDILAKLRQQNSDLEINFNEEIFNKAMILIDKCGVKN